MPTAPANGLEIYYETFGDRDGEPLLLVNGLGSQCISYEPDFCNAFVDRGFFVIRFDNRDVGFSTKIDTPHIDFAPLLAKAFAGERVDAPYVLSDMAADAVGLLDHLGIDAAHIVGMSMGGMVVQTIAVEHPERVRTMTSIMSTTGDRDVGTLDAGGRRGARCAARDEPRRVPRQLPRAVEDPERPRVLRRRPRSAGAAPQPTTAATSRPVQGGSCSGSSRRARGATSCARSTSPRSSSTARSTRSSPSREASAPLRSSREPSSSCSTTWATTCRLRCGRSTSKPITNHASNTRSTA